MIVAAVWRGNQAFAQDDPIVIGEGPKYETLHIDRPHGKLNLMSAFNRDSTRSTESRQFQETFFYETLTLGSTGHIMHPDFLALNLSGTVGTSQSFLDSDGSGDQAYGTVLAWDTQATLLRNGNWPFTLSSQREQQWISRDFGPTLSSVTTATSAALEMRRGVMPGRFEIGRNTQEQTSPEGFQDLSVTRDYFSWFATANIDTDHTLNWSYVYNSVDQNSRSANSYDTHTATVNYTYKFGDKKQHTAATSLYYFNQAGNFDIENMRFNQTLRMRHSPDFDTRYQYSFDQSNYSTSDRTRHRAMAGFTHRLYQSLVTNGQIAVQHVTASDGSAATEVNADLHLDYRKKVPFGSLSASLMFGYAIQSNDARTGVIQVVDDAQAFPVDDRVVIIANNVVPGSILITDPSGISYTPGVDYTLTTGDSFVQIDRVVGGAIPAGGGILVDYRLAPQGASTIDTISIGTRVRYDFSEGWLEGVGIHGGIRLQEQNIDMAFNSGMTPNSYTDILYGADYRWRGLTLAIEHQIHDSTIIPFDAMRASARYQQRIGGKTTVGVNTAWTSVSYPDDNNQVDLISVSASAQHQLTPQLFASAAVLWRDQSDNRHGDTQGFEQQIELRWRHRQTEIYLRGRNSAFDTANEDRSFQRLEIGIQREF